MPPRSKEKKFKAKPKSDGKTKKEPGKSNKSSKKSDEETKPKNKATVDKPNEDTLPETQQPPDHIVDNESTVEETEKEIEAAEKEEKEETESEPSPEEMASPAKSKKSPFDDPEYKAKAEEQKRLKEQRIKEQAERARAEKEKKEQEEAEKKREEAEKKKKEAEKKKDPPKETKKPKGNAKEKGGKGGVEMTDADVKKMRELADVYVKVKNLMDKNSKLVQEHEGILDMVEKQTSSIKAMVGKSQMIWKIPGFKEKYKEATKETEGKTVLYSPEFETHRNGYKMALSLCPNGDGKGKNEYMSIFFTILRGPYDSLQVWPFHHKINFTLLDQAEEPEDRNHISTSFTPNPIKENAPFLGRPQGMRNPSLGIPRFARLLDMWQGHYVDDDTIYIKVEVSSEDMLPL